MNEKLPHWFYCPECGRNEIFARGLFDSDSKTQVIVKDSKYYNCECGFNGKFEDLVSKEKFINIKRTRLIEEMTK